MMHPRLRQPAWTVRKRPRYGVLGDNGRVAVENLRGAARLPQLVSKTFCALGAAMWPDLPGNRVV